MVDKSRAAEALEELARQDRDAPELARDLIVRVARTIREQNELSDAASRRVRRSLEDGARLTRHRVRV